MTLRQLKTGLFETGSRGQALREAVSAVTIHTWTYSKFSK